MVEEMRECSIKAPDMRLDAANLPPPIFGQRRTPATILTTQIILFSGL